MTSMFRRKKARMNFGNRDQNADVMWWLVLALILVVGYWL